MAFRPLTVPQPSSGETQLHATAPTADLPDMATPIVILAGREPSGVVQTIVVLRGMADIVTACIVPAGMTSIGMVEVDRALAGVVPKSLS